MESLINSLACEEEYFAKKNEVNLFNLLKQLNIDIEILLKNFHAMLDKYACNDSTDNYNSLPAKNKNDLEKKICEVKKLKANIAMLITMRNNVAKYICKKDYDTAMGRFTSSLENGILTITFIDINFSFSYIFYDNMNELAAKYEADIMLLLKMVVKDMETRISDMSEYLEYAKKTHPIACWITKTCKKEYLKTVVEIIAGILAIISIIILSCRAVNAVVSLQTNKSIQMEIIDDSKMVDETTNCVETEKTNDENTNNLDVDLLENASYNAIAVILKFGPAILSISIFFSMFIMLMQFLTRDR